MRISRDRANVILAAFVQLSVKTNIKVYVSNDHLGTSHFQLGINWAGCGTVTPEETMEFAKELQNYSKIVLIINTCNLDVDRKIKDKEINNAPSFRCAEQRVVEWVEEGNVAAIQNWLLEGARK